MGYTHYMSMIRDFTPEEWADLQRFLTQAIEATDIPICSGSGTGKPEITAEHIHFNGAGEDSYEDFYLGAFDHGGSFCKTERKPYDVVVAALLIYIHDNTGALEVGSDGDLFGTGPDQWDERTSARALIAKVQECAA